MRTGSSAIAEVTFVPGRFPRCKARCIFYQLTTSQETCPSPARRGGSRAPPRAHHALFFRPALTV